MTFHVKIFVLHSVKNLLHAKSEGPSIDRFPALYCLSDEVTKFDRVVMLNGFLDCMSSCQDDWGVVLDIKLPSITIFVKTVVISIRGQWWSIGQGR